jgi:uncharacterized protein (DUF433 family)
MVIPMTTENNARYDDRIIHDPEILVGKPVIKGTRIPVEVVLEYLERTPDFTELFADYPRLTMDDVKACLHYARTILEEKQQAAPSSHG